MAIIRNRILQQIELSTLTEANMRAQILASKRRLMPDLPDENPGSVSMRMIDLFIVHALKWNRDYGEQILNESFIGTASLYESVYQRAIELGYTPRQEIAATATVTLTLNRAISASQILEKSVYSFRTVPDGLNDAINFEMVEDSVTIPAGSLSGSQHQIAVIQGETVIGEELGISDGEPFQEYETAQGYSIITGIHLYVDDVEWTKVDNLFISDPGDTHFEIIRFTEDGHVVIAFGNGVVGDSDTHGLIPETDAEITIDYRILPGGINGNVAADTITQISPTSSLFSVTNVEAADDWTAREAIDDIRWKAQRAGRIKESIGDTLEEQYITTAENIDGIGRAYVVIGEFGENTVGVHCLNETGVAPDQTILDSVESILESLNPADERVKALKGVFAEFNVSASVWLLDGYLQATVFTAIETALNSAFNPIAFNTAGNRQTTAGQLIYPEHISKIIMDVEGVDRCSVSVPTTFISILSNQLPKIGTITLAIGA